MKRMILIALVLAVGCAVAGWRGRFDEQFAAESTAEWTPARLNPIAWYKGDGNALDAMGNYNGTWADTEAYADGPTGQAFDFDGSSQIGLGANFNFAGNSSFTVSFWIDSPGGFGEEYIISHAGHDINKRAWKIAKLDNRIWLEVFSQGTYNPSTQVDTILPFDSLRHVTVAVDGLYARIYIDGVLKNESDVLARYDTQGLVVTKIASAGSSLSMNVATLKGKVDDVLIFDRALTAEEIELLYNESVNKDGKAW